MENTLYEEDVMIMNDERFDELITAVLQNNTKEFNFNKALEEAVEFQEVLIKLQTKGPEKKPDREEALKEYGDLCYRGMFVLMQLYPEYSAEDLEERVKEHMDYKLSKMYKNLKEGKYTNNI